MVSVLSTISIVSQHVRQLLQKTAPEHYFQFVSQLVRQIPWGHNREIITKCNDTFNYEGHGKGQVKRTKGVDFNMNDMSVNQLWPGIVAGEWHNNHHLYPKSARSGFKRYQIDFAWYYIKFMSMLGAVSSYRDSKKQFYSEYHEPYVSNKKTNFTTR